MRRRQAERRKLQPDPKFKSQLISKFINYLMIDGKKSVAENIVYDALDQIKTKLKDMSPTEALERAIENLKPELEVRSRRVGGATYQVPMEVRAERRLGLAIRWLIAGARGRNEHGMVTRLAAEIMDALEKRGSAYKKLEEVLRMADANQAFAYYRW